MLSTILILTLGANASGPVQAKDPFVEKIGGTLASFKMVPVPEGTLLTKEGPIKIKGFWMSETEVTWDVYDVYAFRLDLTPEQAAAGADAESRPSRPYGAPDRGFGHNGYAAISMTFHAAEQFCKWLSAKTGKKYRLPTEDEWTYAALGGASEPKDSDAYAWHWENSDDKTHPVGKKKPNQFGLYDMLGNAGEWAVGRDGKPVLCGGSFRDKAATISVTLRQHQTPAWNQTDPQNPKSKWWLSDAPFVTIRLVCEG